MVQLIVEPRDQDLSQGKVLGYRQQFRGVSELQLAR